MKFALNSSSSTPLFRGSIQLKKSGAPPPSLHSAKNITVPPFLTALAALNILFVDWYRFISFGYPPQLAITISASFSIFT